MLVLFLTIQKPIVILEVLITDNYDVIGIQLLNTLDEFIVVWLFQVFSKFKEFLVQY